MTSRATLLALAAGAALVPLAFLAGERRVPAADHLDPPARTNPNNDSTPDLPADIADIYVFHDAARVTLILTVGGPAAPNLPAQYDDKVRYAIEISNRTPRTTSDIPIVIQFGQAPGGADAPWGVRVKGVPGVSGDIVGSVERIIEKDGVKVFAGLTDDPFFFDSQGLRESREMGVLRFQKDRDFFGAKNITAMAIEIPRDRIENGSNPVDFWTTSARLGGQL